MRNNIMDNYPQRGDNRYNQTPPHSGGGADYHQYQHQQQQQQQSSRNDNKPIMSSSSSVQPGTIDPSRHEDNLFHLQQELLRQELPSQKQYNEIRQEQSQRLEMYLQQEQMSMWQQQHHQMHQQQQHQQHQMQAPFHQMNEPPTQQQGEFAMANSSMNTRRDGRIGGSFSSFGQQNASALHLSPNNNMMSNNSNNNRSSSDPPFWGQQPQQQMMQQNYGNNNNSKDRSRSMGSSPAPFNMNMMYDMGNSQGSNESTRFGNNDYKETNNNSFQTSSNDQQRQQYTQVSSQEFAPPVYNSNINSMNNNVVTDTRSTPPRSMDFIPANASQKQSSESKRRKVNNSSSDLLLQMLNETVLMSPESIAKPAVGSHQHQHVQKYQASNSCGPTPATSNNVSPFTSNIKPTLTSRQHYEPKISPNPLSTKKENASSVGDTPRLFADYFLSNNDVNHGVDMNAMPPLPLVQAPTNTTTASNSKNGMEPQELVFEQTFLTSKSQDILPLPPSRKSQGSKKKSKSSQKRSSSDGGDKPTGPNPNHIITPTSATISGIAAEIREQMQQQQKNKKKQQASSSTTTSAKAEEGKDTSSSDSNSNEANPQSSNSSSSNNKNDSFSVPQFASTMEASQASQQAIHDWDRKFGLRRAHSKTMRESCRSRKQVLEFLKGAGANLQLLLSESLSAREKTMSCPSVSSDSNSPTCQEKEETVDTTTRYEVGELDRPVHTKKKLDATALPNKGTSREQVEQSPSVSSSKKDNESDTQMSPKKPNNNDTRNDNAKKTSNRPSRRNSVVESKVDDQLQQMFRRASLDCVAGLLPCERRQLRETDRKQYHARGA